MGRKVRSAKGVLVDFDYLKIKEQLASAPTPMEVKNRQNFIENRLKRKLKNKLPIVEKTTIEVEPTLPEPEETIVVVKEEIETEVEDKKKTTKQKARKKKTT